MPKKAVLLVLAGLACSVGLTIALDSLIQSKLGAHGLPLFRHRRLSSCCGDRSLRLDYVRQMKLQSNPLVAIRLAAQEETARQAVVVTKRKAQGR